MDDPFRFGMILVIAFVALVMVMFTITRVYIHSLQKFRLKSQADFLAMAAEIETLKRRVNKLSQMPEQATVQTPVAEELPPVQEKAG